VGIKILSKAHRKSLIYSAYDDAIDEMESDIPKYLETHDVKHLTFKPVDEAEGQYGPAEFWCSMPEWSEAEALFWTHLADLEAFAIEVFRIYAEEFKNIRYDDNGEIRLLQCAKVFDARVGRKAVRPEVLEMIPKTVQVGVGQSIMALSGILGKVLETISQLRAEYDANFSVVPGEHEKNSSPPASSNGLKKSKSRAGGARKTRTSATA
jgi:hypothetical protein